MAADGEGVLFGPGLGEGDGERWRPGVVDGEAGRCPTGDVNFLSFCNFIEKGQKWSEELDYFHDLGNA